MNDRLPPQKCGRGPTQGTCEPPQKRPGLATTLKNLTSIELATTAESGEEVRR